MDELKKYLQNNRGHIDTDMPDEELWKGVKDSLHPPATIPLFVKWMTAACLVLAVGTGIYFFTHPAKKILVTDISSSDTSSATAPADTIAVEGKNAEKQSLLPVAVEKEPVIVHKKKPALKNTVIASRKERQTKPVPLPAPLYGFEGIEASYATMLDIQLERLRTQPIYAEDPAYFHLFKKQFADLARDEEQVKRQLKLNPYDETLLEELITIYQRKIAVLKQLQFEINKMNNKVKQSNAGLLLQKPSYITL
ncbi:MAG: hypothetical protein J0I32_12035 [Sphingobacteriales bacterium]|nr:hypothetical protein [Sphingobacteriales bacterium]OJW00994.1 MAG: hypothetical protein BGO52_06045 [Sphingobacteriales bacterium 44-61]